MRVYRFLVVIFFALAFIFSILWVINNNPEKSIDLIKSGSLINRETYYFKFPEIKGNIVTVTPIKITNSEGIKTLSAKYVDNVTKKVYIVDILIEGEVIFNEAVYRFDDLRKFILQQGLTTEMKGYPIFKSTERITPENLILMNKRGVINIGVVTGYDKDLLNDEKYCESNRLICNILIIHENLGVKINEIGQIATEQYKFIVPLGIYED